MDFVNDVYFDVIYHMDENNKSHLKISHIDEVDNIDGLPNYGFFFFFFFSTLWYLEFGESLSGFKDFHLSICKLPNRMKVFLIVSKAKQLWRKKNMRKWSFGN